MTLLSRDYRIDEYGRAVVNSAGAVRVLAKGLDLKDFVVEMDDEVELFNQQCHQHGKTRFVIDPPAPPIPLEERVQKWNIPPIYLDADVREICLERCERDDERKRVNEEMDLFEERNLVPLLRALVHAVDAFRNNKILWGVGRGSSVASYVLFLLGVHRIDSIRYGLGIREFLR